MRQTIEEAARKEVDDIIYDNIRCEDINYAENNYEAGRRDVLYDSSKEIFTASANWQSKQSPWIRVEERLPKKFNYVLVLYEYKEELLVQSDIFLGEIDFEWECCGEKVLAWMPIPSFDDILEANKDVLERLKEGGD